MRKDMPAGIIPSKYLLPSGQMLQVQEADQELQRYHRAALSMVPPYGEKNFPHFDPKSP